MLDREKLPRGFGKRGGLFCPVCRQEAARQIFNEQDMKIGWMHDGRAWPCVRKLGAGKEQVVSARPVADDARYSSSDGTTEVQRGD